MAKEFKQKEGWSALPQWVTNSEICPQETMLFSHLSSSITHIKDHMLSRSEFEIWCLVAPELSDLVGAGDVDEGRYNLARAMGVDCQLFQTMYGLYARVVQEALDDADRLRWWVESHDAKYAMGCSGLVVVLGDGVLDECVRTAYFAGHADGHEILERATSGNAMTRGPREKVRSYGRGKKRSAQSMKTRDRRRGKWSPERQLFESGFRKSVAFIYGRTDGINREGRTGVGCLKAALPRRSDLSFEGWQKLVAPGSGD
jgi:hypothetical protein